MIPEFLVLAEQAALRAPEFGAVPRPAVLGAARAYWKGSWNEARAQHDAGASGGNVLRLLSDAADTVVRGVAAFAMHALDDGHALQAHAALCALGGYGRRELSPCSDVDVCLLYDGLPDDAVETFTGHFVPFLWDMGLKPGFVAHRVDEAIALAGRDPEVFTAYAQARLLLGEGNVLARLALACDRARAERPRFVLDHVGRRWRAAALPEAHRDLYAREPDIKENAGGLRDIHAAYWTIMVKHGAIALEDLVRLGEIDEDEHLAAIEGRDFLWRLRNELHFHTGQPGNRLSYELQRHAAAAFGYGSDTPEAVGRFMQDYYAAARQLRAFLRVAVRVAGRTGVQDDEAFDGARRAPIAQRGGELWADAGDPWWFAEKPSRLMEVIWHAARANAPLSPASERWLRDNLHLVNDAFRSSDTVRSYFLALCSHPLRAGFALRQAAHAGLLAGYLPEWAAIQGVVRYEDFHSFPVDEHTLRAVEAFARLDGMQGAVARALQDTLDHIRDPHVLVLAVLCHDLGKAEGDTHVEAGVEIAHAIGGRIGLAEDDIGRIAFLVRHHMLMSDIALYRNTDDADVVRSFAETMGSPERLRELLLLTYADLSAVGPDVWTDWKGALLLKLFLRAERFLLGRGVTADEDYWRHPKADAARALLEDRLKPMVEPMLRGLGEQYFLAFTPERIAGHVECLDAAQSAGLAVRWAQVPHTEWTEVVVCTRDHRRLFAEIAGSFTAQLADVHSAALFTAPGGWVVDCFLVTDVAHRRPPTEDQLRGAERVLEAVLLGGDDIGAHVDRSRRRLLALSRPRMPVRTRIEFDNRVSRTDSVIDIETADRTGLLFDIGSCLAVAGIDVHTARIVTDARRVRDAFYVRRGGCKIEDPGEQAALRDRLDAAIRGIMPPYPAGGTA